MSNAMYVVDTMVNLFDAENTAAEIMVSWCKQQLGKANRIAVSNPKLGAAMRSLALADLDRLQGESVNSNAEVWELAQELNCGFYAAQGHSKVN